MCPLKRNRSVGQISHIIKKGGRMRKQKSLTEEQIQGLLKEKMKIKKILI